MKTFHFYFAGSSGALEYCKKHLLSYGCVVSPQPNLDITHLILPAPAFEADGNLKGGGRLEEILPQLSPQVTVIGGNLSHPALVDFPKLDLLEDPAYLAENADITAHCALKAAMNRLNITLRDCPVLVIGWGRIGKLLAQLLRNVGARVSVYARKPADRAILPPLGYDTADITPPAYDLQRFRVIFNTVPAMILPEELLKNCRSDCLKIDLASIPGIAGADTIRARGLPNREAPETSGILMAKTILRLIHREDSK